MKCPICGGTAYLVTPDYGYGYGAQFRCYSHGGEYSFSSNRLPPKERLEALAESEASLSLSSSNAKEIEQK